MRLFPSLLLSVLVASPLAAQSPYTFDFSSINNSKIAFFGASNTFQFVPEGSGSIDFQIDDSDGGYLDGLFGRIEGTFTILENTLQYGFNGKVQCADVTGSGLFQILDGAGGVFSATLSFDEICTITSPLASGGLLTQGTVNLDNFSFTLGTSSNAYTSRLQALVPSDAGTVVSTFEFAPALTVFDLLAQDYNDSSYSGDASLPSVGANIPEPSSYAAALALAGLASTAWLRRRRGV